MRAGFLIGLLFVLAVIPGRAAGEDKTSIEFAKIGSKAVSAFMCSISAEHSENPEEQGRLFMLGFNSAKEFLEAAQTEKVNRKDINSNIAIMFTMRMRGPSVDFIIGRLWEAVTEHYYDELTKDCDSCISDKELKKMKGEAAYREQNCQFLK